MSKRVASTSVSAIKLELASLTETPAKLLVALSFDTSAQVRERVAANSKTPVIVLLKLADDPCESVRAAVAKNWSYPYRLRSILSDELNEKEPVRTAVSF